MRRLSRLEAARALTAAAARRLLRYRPCSKRGRGEAMCATVTAIFTCATSSRSRASPSCSTPSSSTILSPRSTCSTISPSCSWISASAGSRLTRTRSSTPISTRKGSTGNLLGLAALPLFLSMRAMIRAKVEILRASKADRGEIREQARSEARAYFELARDFPCACQRPAPHRHRRIVGQRQVSRGGGDRALMSARFRERFMCGAMSSGSGCSASPRKTQAARSGLCGRDLRRGLRHLPQARAPCA